MIRSTIVSLLLCAALIGGARAQSRIETTSEVSRSTSIKGFARDFYFSPIENYELQGGGGGKYYQMYVVATVATKVHVAVGLAAPKQFPVQAQEVLVYDVPLAWELTESATIEEKAIHVWSDDADLTVSLLSRNPATSGGMTILPTAAWGKEYVVASFACYAYLPGYELPSEFAIIASADSTVVTIDPSTDLRKGISTAVAFPRNKPFTITLQRGQAVQYQASAANGNMEDYDVTGTIIRSNKPVGVVAGVMCANVPAENPYCDHICEMILPVSSWGKEYYTAPFINRKGGDAILVIARDSNTQITRTSDSGTVKFAVLDKFESYMRHDVVGASYWQSDKPFMLVQYLNSTDYPDPGSNNGIGDPAMVVIPPVSHFEKEVTFLAPKIRTAEIQFRNYANVIVHKNAVNSTTVDGESAYQRLNALSLPNTDYSVFRINDVKPGAHTLTSDSGVGVYVYGYGSYDAYSWPGPMGRFSNSLVDSQAASIKITEQCYAADVRLSDEGKTALGELLYRVDSTSNATISPFVTGGKDQTEGSYRFSVIDSSLSAFANLVVVDAGGNRRTITHRYQPDLPIAPESYSLADVPLNGQRTFALPLTSGSRAGLANIQAKLKSGVRFHVTTKPLSIAAGQTDSIILTYSQPTLQRVHDTLVISALCWQHEVALSGAPVPVSDWAIKDTVIDFAIVVLGNERTRQDKIYATGTEPFTLDSVIMSPNTDFSLDAGALPRVLAVGDTAIFAVRFAPTSEGPKSGIITAYTSLGEKSVRLAGQGQGDLGVNLSREAQEIQIYPNPAKDILTAKLGSSTRLSAASARILSVNGTEMLKRSLGGHSGNSFDLNVRSLAAGSYLLEITLSDGETLSRKFVIER